MGIARAIIKLFMSEGKRERFGGNVLTVGRQHVFGTMKHLQRWADEMDFPLKPNLKMSLSNKEEFKEEGYITDITLFHSLGFDSIESIDLSNYEQCTIIHDLNNNVPENLYNKYDFIYDGGASEHIFNFPKVLENYHRMLKVGGRIVHSLPSSNHVDHGLYMFSPTLFFDYYLANNWEIIESLFIKYSQKYNVRLWDIYKYAPGCLDRYSFGGLRGLYTIFFIVKKRDNSTFTASVQQGSYLKLWNTPLVIKTKSSTKISTSWIKRIANRLPYGLKGVLQSLVNHIAMKIPLKFNLELIARY